MKKILLLGLLSFSTGIIFAGNHIPGKVVAPCDNFEATGITNVEVFSQFFTSLQTAAASKGDKAAIVKFIIYPLRVNKAGKSRHVKTKVGVENNFSKIFTDKVLQAITHQKYADLFCRDQGVMIGDGQVWINQQGDKIGIYAINVG
jgi:hypothetical protein